MISSEPKSEHYGTEMGSSRYEYNVRDFNEPTVLSHAFLTKSETPLSVTDCYRKSLYIESLHAVNYAAKN